MNWKSLRSTLERSSETLATAAILLIAAAAFALAGCASINQMQSASDLLIGFCNKPADALQPILTTPTRQCAAFIVCSQVGVIPSVGSSQSCMQAGMRTQ